MLSVLPPTPPMPPRAFGLDGAADGVLDGEPLCGAADGAVDGVVDGAGGVVGVEVSGTVVPVAPELVS